MLQSIIIQNIELIERIFIGLLTGLVKSSNHTKRVLLSNHKYMIQPTRVNLHPNEYSQEFHYYSFDVKLDRCVESCNTLNDLSNEACIPNRRFKSNCHQQRECKCRFAGRN